MRGYMVFVAMSALLVPSVALAESSPNKLQSACAEVRMDCSYNARYDLIDRVWSAPGRPVLFDKASNAYTVDMPDSEFVVFQPPRFYIGSRSQNAKLARNIRANKVLFVGGKLTTKAAKRWKSVP